MKKTTMLIIVFLLLVGLAVAAPTLSKLVPKTVYEKVFTPQTKVSPTRIDFTYTIDYVVNGEIVSKTLNETRTYSPQSISKYGKEYLFSRDINNLIEDKRKEYTTEIMVKDVTVLNTDLKDKKYNFEKEKLEIQNAK